MAISSVHTLPADLPSLTKPQLHVAGIDEVYEMEAPQDRGQWLVSARRDGVLSIMTPVFPDPENLALLLNQVRGKSNVHEWRSVSSPYNAALISGSSRCAACRWWQRAHKSARRSGPICTESSDSPAVPLCHESCE